MRNRMIMGWLLFVLAAAPVLRAQTISDQDVLKSVQARLASEKFAGDVQATVDAGMVTLNGNVASLERRERVAKMVSKVEGVKEVRNLLEIVADTNDQKIAEAAVHVVRTYPYYSIFDNIEVEANNRVLTLRGEVVTPTRKSDLGGLMKSVAGVREIRNELTVLPLSNFDDQIRLRVARAIFDDPSLSRYGMGANPSIHVIVRNGHVTLTGVVQNAMDIALAERAARFAATYFGFTNELRIG
jgi:hyperosmotically inducible protein